MMKRVLSCDYGQKKIGAALGEEESGIVFMKTAFMNTRTVYSELLQTIERESVWKVIVGLPLNMKCEFTESTNNAVRFANKVFSLSGKPLYMVDERYSTAMVYLRGKHLGYSEKDTRRGIDEESAEEILYRYFLNPSLAYAFSRNPVKPRELRDIIDEMETRKACLQVPIELVLSGIGDFSFFSGTKHCWVLKEKNPWFYMKNREKEKPESIVDYTFHLMH